MEREPFQAEGKAGTRPAGGCGQGGPRNGECVLGRTRSQGSVGRALKTTPRNLDNIWAAQGSQGRVWRRQRCATICYLNSSLDNALEKPSGQEWEVNWEALIAERVTQGEGLSCGKGRGMEQRTTVWVG